MPTIYAHRGASGYAPENTLEAFSLAADMHADGVELDVHLTRDDVLVVAHDETVDRVSDGSGRICDMTLSELKQLHFNKTHPEYKNATIPTLEEVYALLKPTGLCVNVELKNSIILYPQLEEKCIALADRMGMRERVLYSSFNHYSMQHIKSIDPSIPCGLLYEATLVRPWEYAGSLKADALHPHFTQLLIPDIARLAHENGIRVHVWTVNQEEDIRMCLEAGADMIITNYPDRAIALRK
ncbi:MAG: glycerophosphodiester phosphodiesterase [Clostridia bacterium]|nr:glycerophosphodiester phosphodiesterase [Clostridia bacterium]